jgi:hypothetical protein
MKNYESGCCAGCDTCGNHCVLNCPSGNGEVCSVEEERSGKRKSVLISAGNSSQGPVGFCARVKAYTKEEAIEKFSSLVPECIEARRHLDPDEAGDVEYFNVYFNENALTVKDIDEGETEYDDE